LAVVERAGPRLPRPEKEIAAALRIAIPSRCNRRRGIFAMNGSVLARFLGGSPMSVALRLFVVSFIVGALLVMWGIELGDIVDGVAQMFRRLAAFALTDFRQFGRVLITGAIVVVPIWLILRLLDARRSR
jgi:hypothetical protein